MINRESLVQTRKADFDFEGEFESDPALMQIYRIIWFSTLVISIVGLAWILYNNSY